MGEITQLLECVHDGDPDAWDRVITLLYDDLLRLARRTPRARDGATVSPTVLVHECYLRLQRNHPNAITDSGHFLATASLAMRQIMVNYARDRMAAKRGGGAAHVPLHDIQVSAEDREADDVIMLNDALERLADKDRQLSQIVDCRVFGGLTENETADALGISLRTMQRQWHKARKQLRATLQID